MNVVERRTCARHRCCCGPLGAEEPVPPPRDRAAAVEGHGRIPPTHEQEGVAPGTAGVRKDDHEGVCSSHGRVDRVAAKSQYRASGCGRVRVTGTYNRAAGPDQRPMRCCVAHSASTKPRYAAMAKRRAEEIVLEQGGSL